MRKIPRGFDYFGDWYSAEASEPTVEILGIEIKHFPIVRYISHQALERFYGQSDGSINPVISNNEFIRSMLLKMVSNKVDKKTA